MRDCLEVSDLQGYLEESGPTPLRRRVEQHLVSCGVCRVEFDRVVATHQRVNAWLGALQSPADDSPVMTSAAWTNLLIRIESPAVSPAGMASDHLARLLAPAAVEVAWYVSLYRSVRDLVRPEKLPPLRITSKPVAVKSIWGLYAPNVKSFYSSAGILLTVFSVLMFAGARAVIENRKQEISTIIDPNLKPYIPPQKKMAGGGGGGGARELTPVTRGQAPKPALKQFTPPMIVKEQPRLPMTPTIIAPPDSVIPQNNLPNWGDPLAKLSNLSNGQGFGGGMGNGSGGGLGNGKGGGYGAGEGGGVGGAIFRVGGGVSQPSVLVKVDPEYSEEARKAKYSGSVTLAIVVDADGHARDIRVVKSLGMGLDEKAIEAVAKWKFRPGMKGGQPVNVRATIEVNFRLL
jgi:TonB family protein